MSYSNNANISFKKINAKVFETQNINNKMEAKIAPQKT